MTGCKYFVRLDASTFARELAKTNFHVQRKYDFT